MAQITEQQHENLIDRIYKVLISHPDFDNGDIQDIQNCSATANDIVNDWEKENNIEVIEN